MNPSSRTVATTCLVALTVALAPAIVLAGPATGGIHLRLTASSPEAEAMLEESPDQIRLWFSLEPEAAVSMIRLQAGEERIELGDLTADEENSLVAAVSEPLPDGAYTIVWRTSSGDGHPIRGEIPFTIAATR